MSYQQPSAAAVRRRYVVYILCETRKSVAARTRLSHPYMQRCAPWNSCEGCCDARFVLCTGYDHLPGTSVPYTVNVPLARAIEPDVLLVHTWDGQPLPRAHGGPCRIITPKLYAWKGAKWIRTIDFLAEDQKGFWEVRGYSNTAEPWFNDRYSTE